MSSKERTAPQIIKLIKNIKKVSTNHEVAKLLGISPKLLAAYEKGHWKVHDEVYAKLRAFADKEHIAIDYLRNDIESWMQDSQILWISCIPIAIDHEKGVREVFQSNVWKLCYVFKMKTSELAFL